jgi:hypothetical protein
VNEVESDPKAPSANDSEAAAVDAPSPHASSAGHPKGAPRGHVSDTQAVAFVADLDVPGETGRQARVFLAWALCLGLAVIGGSIVGAHVADESLADRELSRARIAKTKVALVLGLALPILLTIALNRRYRRGGAHARGIVVEVTPDGELRLWGRGYGSRVILKGAEVNERLVDVYAGRLGAWRQRRLRVRTGSASNAGARVIEIAAPARASDVGLPLEGGEGDCVELERPDYDAILAEVRRRSR